MDRKITEVPDVCRLVTWSYVVSNFLATDTYQRTREGLRKTTFTQSELRLIATGAWWPINRCIHTTLDVTRQPHRPRMAVKYPRNWGPDRPHSGTVLLVSHLAAYARSRSLPSAGQTASHVHCDNPLCVNPLHLVWEELDYQQTREACRYWRNEDANFLCPHDPHCFGFSERRTNPSQVPSVSERLPDLRPDQSSCSHIRRKPRAVQPSMKRSGRRGGSQPLKRPRDACDESD